MQNVLLQVKAVSSQYLPSGYRGGQLVSSEKSRQLFLIGSFSKFLRFLYTLTKLLTFGFHYNVDWPECNVLIDIAIDSRRNCAVDSFARLNYHRNLKKLLYI